MSRNTPSTVYIGNLDERVSEKVLYEIMIQAGRLVDLHMPRDKETNKHKGYAFAEYESPEIADYAIHLFSGLVRLYNRPARFAMSGQDRQSAVGSTPPVTPPMTPGSSSPEVQSPASSRVGRIITANRMLARA
ncbi:RNA-binding protein 7 [Carex littledalei]|uniref:RNA-binding protein 7 n=1 Tax=Carex littledalei TaxID=544730 RepID=A0A833VLW3_9POAL|nr:RNA-binding protein 7 [Carex littledalei]